MVDRVVFELCIYGCHVLSHAESFLWSSLGHPAMLQKPWYSNMYKFLVISFLICFIVYVKWSVAIIIAGFLTYLKLAEEDGLLGNLIAAQACHRLSRLLQMTINYIKKSSTLPWSSLLIDPSIDITSCRFFTTIQLRRSLTKKASEENNTGAWNPSMYAICLAKLYLDCCSGMYIVPLLNSNIISSETSNSNCNSL